MTNKQTIDGMSNAVTLPRVPTIEMIEALAGVVSDMFGIDDCEDGFRSAYAAMISAAPQGGLRDLLDKPAKVDLVECDACPTSGGCVSVCMKAPKPAAESQGEAALRLQCGGMELTIWELRQQLAEREALLRSAGIMFKSIEKGLRAFHEACPEQCRGHLDDALGGAVYQSGQIDATLSTSAEPKPRGEAAAFERDDEGVFTVSLEDHKKSSAAYLEHIEQLKSQLKNKAQKYDDTLLPFVTLMRRELHANAGKGDRPAWLKMSADTALLEIIYHFGKLQKAVRDSNSDAMSEYAADVANLCMMLLDICGALAFVDSAPSHSGGANEMAAKVVLPERKTKADYSGYIEQFQGEAAGLYNSALDDVAKLNGLKP